MLDNMRKWAVVTFVIVIVTALILGSSLQMILSLLPEEQQQGVAPFVGSIGITVIIANGIVAVMQWFGVSPLDFLPERSLKDTLRKQNPYRFKLTQSRDHKFLEEQAKAAKNQKQHDWVYLFAEAWMNLRPNDPDAYDAMGDALIELNKYSEAIAIGEKLTKLAPLDHSGFSIVGKAYQELGQPEQARIWHENALKVVAPNFKQFVLSDLIKVYEVSGLVDQAVKSTEEYIKVVEDKFTKDLYRKKLEHFRQIQSNMRHV